MAKSHSLFDDSFALYTKEARKNLLFWARAHSHFHHLAATYQKQSTWSLLLPLTTKIEIMQKSVRNQKIQHLELANVRETYEAPIAGISNKRTKSKSLDNNICNIFEKQGSHQLGRKARCRKYMKTVSREENKGERNTTIVSGEHHQVHHPLSHFHAPTLFHFTTTQHHSFLFRRHHNLTTIKMKQITKRDEKKKIERGTRARIDR